MNTKRLGMARFLLKGLIVRDIDFVFDAWDEKFCELKPILTSMEMHWFLPSSLKILVWVNG